jgi:hypothetical protein
MLSGCRIYAFGAGLYPMLLKWLSAALSLDRNASLGAKLW